LLKKWQLRRVLAVCEQKKREAAESEEYDSSEVRRNSRITRMEELLTARPNFLAMNLVQLWDNVLRQRRQYEEQRNELQTLTQQITELRAEATSMGQLLRTVELREEQNNGNTFDGFHLCMCASCLSRGTSLPTRIGCSNNSMRRKSCRGGWQSREG
jgi:cell division protein FtsB